MGTSHLAVRFLYCLQPTYSFVLFIRDVQECRLSVNFGLTYVPLYVPRMYTPRNMNLPTVASRVYGITVAAKKKKKEEKDMEVAQCFRDNDVTSPLFFDPVLLSLYPW